MNPFWKKVRLIAGLILVVGLIKMPLESGLVRSMQEDGFHRPMPQSTLSQQIGVQGSIGLLGGLRYMVATFLELQTIDHWIARPPEWEKLADDYELVTMLQPQDEESWSTFAWHLAYNAVAWYKFDDEENLPVVRQALEKEYLDRGREMLLRGIDWNPESYLLIRDLATLYEHKYEDSCKAAEWYYRASQLEDAPSFLYRFYAYNLAKCPGKEEEAYKVLMGLYEQGKGVLKRQRVMIWKPTLIASIKELEVSLKIPEDQRIPEYLDRETLQIITPNDP